jgi:hypothetical protein
MGDKSVDVLVDETGKRRGIRDCQACGRAEKGHLGAGMSAENGETSVS